MPKSKVTRAAARAARAEMAAHTPGYRVVYGETLPMWEQIFATTREARAFSKRCKDRGDIVFGVRKVVPGEEPQSITAAIAKAKMSAS